MQTPNRPEDDVLALTSAPLETAGERAFFAELARWDTGGSVRAAVVASLPRFDDGPLRRRTADAVLFVPEGLAVVRVAEVERQSGTVTASPDGAWTIGPAGAPGEVLQLAGGGSSPLDGLMRAGMDTAVRLRRAGLEPGRIARLTVLVGGVSGVVPEDGDLGEGDQVASLEPRSLLLGIARASRYAGVDNPRLWTTADVRAALEALELPGRGPSVEELNGEAFPYSPYVLRRPELLGPVGLAVPAAAAPGAPGLAVAPAPRPAARAVPPAPAVPVPAAVPTPAAVPVPAAVPPPTAAPVPAAAGADETGGIGGLFAGAERDTRAPAVRPRGPAAVPVPPSVRPATAVLTPTRPPVPLAAPAPARAPVPVPPTAPAPIPVGEPAPTVRVDGLPARPDPGMPWRGRRGLLVVAAAAVLLLGAVVAGAGALGGGASGGGSAPAGAGSPSPVPEPAAQGLVAGDTAQVEGRTFTAQAVDLADSCAAHAYGQVAQFFAAAECSGLSRALWATQLEGRAVVVSVSRVRMPDAAAARDLQSLTDTSGTGNVNDLLREGVRYTGGPESLSGSQYASAVSGPVVTVVETSWVQEGAGEPAEIDAVADAALALQTPPFPAA